MVDYAQCLLGFFGNWAQKSWGSCIAPWENPSSDCWGSDPSLMVLSCLRREGLVAGSPGWRASGLWVFMCVYRVQLGACDLAWGWSWKASLLNGEGQEVIALRKEENHYLLGTNCCGGSSAFSHLIVTTLWAVAALPERKLWLRVVKMLKVLGTRSFQLWFIVLFNMFGARKQQALPFLCLAFVLKVNWGGWQTALSNLQVRGWWDPFIWLLKASLTVL